jgi:arsenate reductase
LVDAAFGGLRWRHAFACIPAQVAGCIAGAIAANLMFDLSAVSIATTHRATTSHLFAEVIATLGLLLVIFALARSGRGNLAPAAVGAYIGSAYFFTSSTSFANPAIDVGRMFSDTFAGIAPASVPAFVVVQLLGGVVGIVVIRVLYPTSLPWRRRRSCCRTVSNRLLPALADRSRLWSRSLSHRRSLEHLSCKPAPISPQSSTT